MMKKQKELSPFFFEKLLEKRRKRAHRVDFKKGEVERNRAEKRRHTKEESFFVLVIHSSK